jgi:hypothetical protein
MTLTLWRFCDIPAAELLVQPDWFGVIAVICARKTGRRSTPQGFRCAERLSP